MLSQSAVLVGVIQPTQLYRTRFHTCAKDPITQLIAGVNAPWLLVHCWYHTKNHVSRRMRPA